MATNQDNQDGQVEYYAESTEDYSIVPPLNTSTNCDDASEENVPINKMAMTVWNQEEEYLKTMLSMIRRNKMALMPELRELQESWKKAKAMIFYSFQLQDLEKEFYGFSCNNDRHVFRKKLVVPDGETEVQALDIKIAGPNGRLEFLERKIAELELELEELKAIKPPKQAKPKLKYGSHPKLYGDEEFEGLNVEDLNTPDPYGMRGLVTILEMPLLTNNNNNDGNNDNNNNDGNWEQQQQ